MNRHDNTMTPGRKLVGLTLVAAMGAALGCSSSPGTSTPGTGGSGTGKGGSTGTAGATGSGGSSTGGSGGTSGGGTGGSATGTGGSSTGGTGGTSAGGSGGSATGGSGGSGTGGSGGSGTGGSGGTGTGGGGGTTTLTVPPTLNVPAGATLKMHFHAMGDQIYTCTPSSTGGGGGTGGAGGAGGGGTTTYSFVLKQPDAKLYDGDTQVATHGAGPNWTSIVDNSVVVGAKIYQENSTTAGAIPWLLLRATSHTGTGVFSDVTYVQRVNTVGGVAPTTGCDSTTANTDTRVSYMADYYFYTGGGPGTDWMTPPGNLATAIQVPSGAALKIHDHAIGVQVYTCTASSAGGAGGGGGGAGGAGGGGATTYSWVLKQPDAVLYDSSFAMVGTHGLGPNWTSSDGSVVNGAKVNGVNSPVTGAVQWLLLQATSNTGTGVFSDITYVQRLNTAGGAAAGTCDATTVTTEIRIPYSADYYFFTGGLTDGGTNG
jgi:hypothetical protein